MLFPQAYLLRNTPFSINQAMFYVLHYFLYYILFTSQNSIWNLSILSFSHFQEGFVIPDEGGPQEEQEEY